VSEKESVKFRGQSGHAAHDQPFSEVPDSGIPQVSKIRRAPKSFSMGLSEDLRIAINGNTQAWEYLRKWLPFNDHHAARF
jgi:hypothetical protein